MKTLSVLIGAAALFGGVQLFHGGTGESVAEEAAPPDTYRLVANGDEGFAQSNAAPPFRTACRF